MRILVLGGTRFVGRHVVSECLAREHDVTLVCRGRTPSPFVGVVRHVVTDRRAPTDDAKRALAERWDAVIDTSASDLDDVEATTPQMRAIGRYLFVSTCGVYSRRARGPHRLTERSATIRSGATDPTRATATRKLRCERFLQRQLGRLEVPLLIARLGLVVGKFDYTERLAYWLERGLRGGDVLVPMDPNQALQLIDAHDVAQFLLNAIDAGLTGIVNVAGPHTTAWQLIETVRLRASESVAPCWVGEDFALASGLRPWTEVPLWLPSSSPETALMAISTARAEEAGLSHRPLEETVADSLAWQAVRRGWSQRWLDRPRELQLLREWRG